METDPVSKTLCCFVVFGIPDDGQSPKTAILSASRGSACFSLHTHLLLGLLFNPKDQGYMSL
jgi:hypothetical protein